MYSDNKLSLLQEKKGEIAIVGMACRFPGSNNYDEFWNNLIDAKNCITEIPSDRWDRHQYYGKPQNRPDKTKCIWGGFLSDIDKFDAGFFKISPDQAVQMDPQQRILLEETWHCIEDSGISLKILQNHKTAVIIGTVSNDYQLLTADIDSESDSDRCVCANRISAAFGFDGPSLSISSDSASSLSAIYEAKQKLNCGECDFAIVAASNVILHPRRYQNFEKELSPEGCCKIFDQSANGYVFAEGVGVVLLCKKERALKISSRIHGLIKGAAVNHSGVLPVLAAPNVEAQKAVITSALRDSGVSPLNISYIEADGAAASLGDLIEVEALRQVYTEYTDKRDYCYLGSVKSNLGHLEAAAGMAGLIKVLLMIRKREIPESLYISHPNPLIDFKQTPFKLSRTRSEWKPASTDKLIAGISSFGRSGVNAHIIVENYDPAVSEREGAGSHIFGLSAQSKKELDQMVNHWREFAVRDQLSDYDLIDISHCCMAGRMDFPQRMGKVIASQSDLVELLVSYSSAAEKNEVIHCHIGNLKISGIHEINASIQNQPNFKKGVKQCLRGISKKERKKYLQELYSPQWNEKEQDELTLLAIAGYFYLLESAGVRLGKVSGTGIGFWAALMISGMIDYVSYYQIKKGLLKWSELILKRPRIVFYDLVSQSCLFPYKITPQYFRHLVDEDLSQGLDLKFCLDKARELMLPQFPFKKMIATWDHLTDGKITDFINHPPEQKKDQNLLIVAIASSLERVNQTWLLSMLNQEVGKPLKELVQLIVRGYLTEKEFLLLQSVNASDFTELCESVFERFQADDGKPGEEFFVLQKYFNTLDEIENVEAWIAWRIADNNRHSFELDGNESENIFICKLDLSLKEVLHQFWIKGQDINWDLFDQSKTLSTILMLPGYPFARERFWLPDDVVSAGHDEMFANDRMAKSTQQPLFNLQNGNPLPLPQQNISDPIAIIGISGKFPQADTPEDFWNNLLEGRDCITELPQERRDWGGVFDNPAADTRRADIERGGFLSDIACFDPQFFGISPQEAELMDPQQRLIMEYIWNVIEDAGYPASALSGSNTGIFIGTHPGSYHDLLALAGAPIETYGGNGALPSAGPNRMSYYLNLHGPSEPVETACSSALVAIHRAASALESDNCEMAIAGGINIILTPFSPISYDRASILTDDGCCNDLSNNSNRYVRSEGIGMVFLKKLSQAEKDGDRIYGLIRATAQNHSGHTETWTAPNPKAQAELIKTAVRKAHIDPRTINYIETHGIGNPLGDPAEIDGITQAFKALYQEYPDTDIVSFGGDIGSVKSSIGHLEYAAGIAAVIKVLLSMKYKTLPPGFYDEEISPRLDLKDISFQFIRNKKYWEPIKNEAGTCVPRRAGISSFGVGGVNAHIILEEYQSPQAEADAGLGVTQAELILFPISAKDCERLTEYTKHLLNFIRSDHFEGNLSDLAYTYQIGREHMDERLGFIAHSAEDLAEKLTKFITGQYQDETDIFYGQADQNKPLIHFFTAEEEFDYLVDKWVADKKFNKIIELWSKGLSFDWNKLYGMTRPRRISAPTYPFARQRFWVNPRIAHHAFKGSKRNERLHVLLHENISVFAAQCFRSSFTGAEYFLNEHRRKGQKALPETAHLEMARAAAVLSTDQKVIELNQIVWSHPVIVTETEKDVCIRLVLEDGGIKYEVYGRPDQEQLVYSRGIVKVSSIEPAIIASINLQEIISLCPTKLDRSACYQCFAAVGVDYAPAFRSIEMLYTDGVQVLSKLQLPESLKATAAHFELHPSLFDGALQSVMGLFWEDGHLAVRQRPYGIDKVRLRGAIPDSVYALVRKQECPEIDPSLKKYDIKICDETGKVLLDIEGLTMHFADVRKTVNRTDVEKSDTICTKAVWLEAPFKSGDLQPDAVLIDKKRYRFQDYFIKDHRIYERSVLMGMAFVSQFHQYMQNYAGEKPIVLNRTIFFDPLYLDQGEEIVVETKAVKTAGMDFSLECSYQKENCKPAIAAVTDAALAEVKGPSFNTDILALFEQADFVLEPALFYIDPKQTRYRKSLFSLKSIKKVLNGVIGEIKLSPEIRSELEDFTLNPAILDAGHHLTLFLDLEDLKNVTANVSWLPLLIKKTVIHTKQLTDSTVYCYAQKVKENPEVKEYDLDFYNSENQLMVSLEGLTCRSILTNGKAAQDTSQIHVTNVSISEDRERLPQFTKQMEIYLKSILSTVGGIKLKEISNEINLWEIGMDDSALLKMLGVIEQEFSIELSPTLFFKYQNIKTLTHYFLKEHHEALASYFNIEMTNYSDLLVDGAGQMPDQPSVSEDIAIIGMHGSYAGSSDLGEFWKNIADQTDLITEIPDDHFDYRPWFDPNPGVPDRQYSKWGSFIDDVDKFDADFFQIPPHEAELMDPQLRLLLQAMYHAAEDAGYGATIKGSHTGVFTGISFSGYHPEQSDNPKVTAPNDTAALLANRPSCYFNMTGPGLPADMPYCSSLVALHRAIESLNAGECEMAFANGVNLLLSSQKYRYLCSLGALSQSGRCHSFDAAADGYVPGEGLVSVLLKPLEQAQRDGDLIHAVIKGSAIAPGGYHSSITAPDVAGEADVILRAWKNAGIDPAALGYIEGRSTGTKLGDLAEIEALQTAFRNYRCPSQNCAIGTVKAHIGHTENAAGLTGVVKVILSMKHRMIPAMPMFEQLNPLINLDGSPLYINRENQEWVSRDSQPLLAGVSSFGSDRTYAHVVIEEWPESGDFAGWQPAAQVQGVIIPLSAKTSDRLSVYGQHLLDYLKQNQVVLSNLAYSLQTGREEMDYRMAVIADTQDELQQKLERFVNGETEIEGLVTGHVKADSAMMNLFGDDEFLKEVMAKWVAYHSIDRLAELWVRGGTIDWRMLYPEEGKPVRIFAPTYPFAKDRYWVNHNADFTSKQIAASEDSVLTLERAIEKDIKQLLHEILKIAPELLDHDTPLEEFGLDSVALIIFANKLSQLYGLNIIPSIFFQYSSIGGIQRYLIDQNEELLMGHYQAAVSEC